MSRNLVEEELLAKDYIKEIEHISDRKPTPTETFMAGDIVTLREMLEKISKEVEGFDPERFGIVNVD